MSLKKGSDPSNRTSMYDYSGLTPLRWFLLACIAAQTLPLFGATYYVGSLPDLTARVNGAVAGDRIILSNGVYNSSSALNITRVGTAANPIVIQAATVGGAEITGAKGFTLSSPAAYITIQ